MRQIFGCETSASTTCRTAAWPATGALNSGCSEANIEVSSHETFGRRPVERSFRKSVGKTG